MEQEKQTDENFKEIYRLLGKRRHLPLETKIFAYRAIIKFMCVHIELRGYASIYIIKGLNPKSLERRVYISNQMLHNDLGIPFIKDVIQQRSTKYHARLETHVNSLM